MEKIQPYNNQKCPTQWTAKDIKDAMSNIMSEKQKNHIKQNKKWLTENHQEVTAKAVEK